MAKNRIFDLSHSVSTASNVKEESKTFRSNIYLNQLNEPNQSPEGELTKIPIKLIDASNNPRKHFSDESIKELATNIKSMGLLQPIVVRKKGKTFELIAGERRIRALVSIGEEYIDAIVKNVDQIDPLIIPEYRLIENIQREDLKDIETALSLSEIRQRNNYSISDLMIRFGKSESWVKQKLAHAAMIDKLISEKKVSSIGTLSNIPTSIILNLKPQLEKNVDEVLSWLLPQIEEGIVPKRTEVKEFSKKIKEKNNFELLTFDSKIEKLESLIKQSKLKIESLQSKIRQYQNQINSIKKKEKSNSTMGTKKTANNSVKTKR
ncbi:ParB/RepB/Spo0J family partition protein [Leptospira santarosai]|uniref:ParB/RepB/Spo0J family partition protein n=1 Tax=Leptospira santarosai TaxID=28183 RepID=UPI00062D6A6A|nr:ParB/RepB/Spo0J family partition protein [Leptospira santarosai]AVV79203.1 ParB-like protein [Leptospira santarosai]MDI7174823.1 ParB/RepB/Spo0J family partition protein [Leptospira santarosai]MDI7193818.1 ParB/RepB/Spo0J family partition protein [Leptospira santarosai]MDO6395576.1 ParB/RepB/Spo0J family partition protein [Leptospira santarosai]MDO6398875.1 ParB/RepB/Spo0J family partition protein [Leptospira santarosai]